MKRQRLLCITVLSVVLTNAQITNTFPDDGRAGIGTISPSSELEVNPLLGMIRKYILIQRRMESNL